MSGELQSVKQIGRTLDQFGNVVSDQPTRPKLLAHRNLDPPFGGGTHSPLPLPDRNLLVELREYPSLWNPTAAECARYWLETYPAGTHLHLEPSIWQDYPGSFS